MENVGKYLVCLALHNDLRLTDNTRYSPASFVDSEDKNGNLLPVEWRLLKGNLNNGGLIELTRVRGLCIQQNKIKQSLIAFFVRLVLHTLFRDSIKRTPFLPINFHSARL